MIFIIPQREGDILMFFVLFITVQNLKMLSLLLCLSKKISKSGKQKPKKNLFFSIAAK